jgi:hypothetical protein
MNCRPSLDGGPFPCFVIPAQGVLGAPFCNEVSVKETAVFYFERRGRVLLCPLRVREDLTPTFRSALSWTSSIFRLSSEGWNPVLLRIK